MTVPRSRKPKPTATDEVARVLHIARMIDEELRALMPPQGLVIGPDTTITYAGAGWDILATAERIAARTEG